MEYNELKILWEQYDTKLNNLEKLNKKLILETLMKKPRQKINWHKFKNYYAIIAPPIIMVIALHPEFKAENIDGWFITGCILLIAGIIFNFFLHLKVVKIIRKVDLHTGSIRETVQQMNSYKQQIIRRYKTGILNFPVLFLGVLFLVGDFDRSSLVFMAILFIIALTLGYTQFQKYKQRIDKLKADIQNLEEYEL